MEDVAGGGGANGVSGSDRSDVRPDEPGRVAALIAQLRDGKSKP